jgi:hypothetical protein
MSEDPNLELIAVPERDEPKTPFVPVSAEAAARIKEKLQEVERIMLLNQAAALSTAQERIRELEEALKAMLTVMDASPKPVKLDAALTWRECDEKARAMARAALNPKEKT